MTAPIDARGRHVATPTVAEGPAWPHADQVAGTWERLRPILERLRDDPAAPLRTWPNLVDPGTGGPPYSIWLAAWAVDAAAELDHEFGPDVELRVGFLRYPSRDPGDADADADVGAGAETGADRLRAEVAPSPTTACPHWIVATPDQSVAVASGHDLRTSLVVRNDGEEAVHIRTNGMVTATIVDPTTHRTVGGFAGAQTLALVTFVVAPGSETRLPLLVGTASLDPNLGYAVPPGAWAYTVELELDPSGRCRLGEIPVTVLP